MKTVGSYAFPHEAHIARARLGAEGIPAFVCDEHTINMQWLYSHALGGVRVQVPEEFADRALEILSRDYSDELEDLFPAEPWRCAACGSERVEAFQSGKPLAFFMFWLVQFPLWRTRRRLRCADCGAVSDREH